MAPDTRDFARRMAIQSVSYWRKAKAAGLPKTARYYRREAMFFMRAFNAGV